jgi:hypothetical protein
MLDTSGDLIVGVPQGAVQMHVHAPGYGPNLKSAGQILERIKIANQTTAIVKRDSLDPDSQLSLSFIMNKSTTLCVPFVGTHLAATIAIALDPHPVSVASADWLINEVQPFSLRQAQGQTNQFFQRRFTRITNASAGFVWDYDQTTFRDQ